MLQREMAAHEGGPNATNVSSWSFAMAQNQVTFLSVISNLQKRFASGAFVGQDQELVPIPAAVNYFVGQ